MKFWFKTYDDDKITRSLILTRAGAISEDVFVRVIREAAEQFDLSTPIILSQHYSHFMNFNSVKFLPRDFIDEVDFVKFTVENASD